MGVTPEEEARLAQLAAAQGGITIPRLLVESALSERGGATTSERHAAMTELFAVHRLLAAISNNINQIARATNVTGQWQAQTGATLDAVRRTAERIDAAIDELSRP